jgi:hypothetical protein
MTRQIRPATNVNTLNDRINKAAGDIGSGLRLRSAVATTAVAQMLPPGAVKGGAAMKLRLGHEHTRFTRDLDLARRDPLDQFVADLQSRLDRGWGGFSGRLVKRQAPRPAGVPQPYIMQPYEVKLAFRTRSWMTLPLELGHDEIGDTRDTVPFLADDLVRLFGQLGLDRPELRASLTVT